MSKLAQFDKTLTELEQEVGNLKGTSEAYKKLQGLVHSYDKISVGIKGNSEMVTKLASKFDVEHEEIKKTVKGMVQTNENHFDNLRRQNRDAYLDFEKTLKIKLDENKAEISRLIESERQRIKEIVGIEMSKMKNLILIFGVLTIVFLIGVIVILLMK